ncbi:MAG: ATP-binding protein, partial [Candidatus Bathyarchaeia archaeon]
DKERVLDGLEGAAVTGQKQFSRQYFDKVLSGLGKRIFLMNDVHEDAPVVFETRWAMSYLRGPLTREQIKLLVEPIKKQRQESGIMPKPTTIQTSTVAAQAELTITRSKPLLPANIREYFMPFEKPMQQHENFAYQPMLIGAARIQYSLQKEGIYKAMEKVFVTPIRDMPVPVNWDEAKEVNLKISDLSKEPHEDLPYSDLPAAALNAKNYVAWEKEFLNWLLRTQKIKLFRSLTFNQLSKPEETERDFRIRLQQAAREKRDQEVERLRQKYASNFVRLDERIRKAKMTFEEQEAQAKSQKYQTAVSLGETILSSFLGRKSTTRAARATREISRTMKEKRDKERAEENLKALQEERQKLEEHFQSEISKIEAKLNPLDEDLEIVEYLPNKTSTQIQLIGLVWAPSKII